MVDYAKLQTTATQLIESNGQPATLRKTIEGTFNPTTGEDGSSTVEAYSASAALFQYNEDQVDGSRILESDLYCLMNVIGAVPEVGDTLEANGTVFDIIGVRTQSPGGTDVYHRIQLRL